MKKHETQSTTTFYKKTLLCNLKNTFSPIHTVLLLNNINKL